MVNSKRNIEVKVKERLAATGGLFIEIKRNKKKIENTTESFYTKKEMPKGRKAEIVRNKECNETNTYLFM